MVSCAKTGKGASQSAFAASEISISSSKRGRPVLRK